MAPAHRNLVCAGVFVFSVLLAACDKDGPARSSRSIEVTGDTVQLPAGVAVHEVKVKATSTMDFEPGQVTARPGDVVRFTTADNRTHALLITGPNEQANAMLDSTSQRRSPPLIRAGQAWIVSLKSLPAGTYQISCNGHAGTAALVIR